MVSWKPPRDDDVAGYTVTATPGGKSTTVGATATSAVVNGLDAGTAYTFTVSAHDRDGAGEASKPSAPVVPVALPQDPVSAFQLDLDEVGNPTRVVTTRGGISESVAYAYDKVDRLTSACYAAAVLRRARAGRPGGSTTATTWWATAPARSAPARPATTPPPTSTTTPTSSPSEVAPGAPARHRVTDYGYDVNGNQTRAGTDRFEYNLDNTLAKATVGGRDADVRVRRRPGCG